MWWANDVEADPCIRSPRPDRCPDDKVRFDSFGNLGTLFVSVQDQPRTNRVTVRVGESFVDDARRRWLGATPAGNFGHTEPYRCSSDFDHRTPIGTGQGSSYGMKSAPIGYIAGFHVSCSSTMYGLLTIHRVSGHGLEGS